MLLITFSAPLRFIDTQSNVFEFLIKNTTEYRSIRVNLDYPLTFRHIYVSIIIFPFL